MDNSARNLRRLKGLLVITSDHMAADRAELAMNTLTMALATVGELSPEEIDTGMMLDSDLNDVLAHDPATSEMPEVAAVSNFRDVLARMTGKAAQFQ